jgi:hypothetical protein
MTAQKLDTQEFEPSNHELSCKELDAVSGGKCTNADVEWVVKNWQNPLARAWLHMGCPVN